MRRVDHPEPEGAAPVSLVPENGWPFPLRESELPN